MIVRKGIVVSHTKAVEWGVGKVMEVTALRATIQFNDGIIRKIAASHYDILLQADAAEFLLADDAAAPVPKVRAASKGVKKAKVVVGTA
jgi:Protein of unknown function (DUF3553)